MRLSVKICLCAIALGLTGCAGAFDPFQRPGNWAETGASNEDIAQEVAVKSDLINGASEPLTNGVVASAGIDKALGANGAGTAAGLQTTTTIQSNAATITSQ